MILRPLLFRSIKNIGLAKLNYSNKPKDLVFFINDMAICWHPEKKFPYECSKPLPKIEAKAESILKITPDEVNKVYQREPPRACPTVADELARITYTTKHIWFPRSRDKKAKKTIPNRPYL